MKNKIFIALIVCFLSTSCQTKKSGSGTMLLPREWKFQKGDSAIYSNPDFNDQNWKNMKVDTFWEYQGLANYDGIGWYRTKVIIPSTLKKSGQLLKTIRLSLGRIDDEDVTYFNDKKVGVGSVWDIDRTYLVPFDLVNWDKENFIAVRVKDNDGNGGMYGSPHSIDKVRLSDIVELQVMEKPEEFKIPNSTFSKTLQFHFKMPFDKISGSLKVKIYEPKSQTVVFEESKEISIGKNADSTYFINVALKKPDTYRIDYSFTVPSLDTLTYSTLFSYASIPRTEEHMEFPVVKQAIQGKAAPFNLEDLQVEGYLGNRIKANLTERLLQIDERGILECYYNRPGNQTWIGEYVGKYLHAASRVWLTTHDSRLKAQMDRIVDILIGCQNADGYLGTYLPANYWKDWDVWAHKYNLLGLLSYYSATGYKPALETSIRMGDLLCKTFGEGKGKKNIILSSPHLGLASTSVLEPMTDLYRYTGNKKYLDFCNYIIKAYEYDNGPKIISTLTTIGKVDKVADAKAYEMMSNFTGIVKLYQITGDKKLLETVQYAWNDISKYKLYITGTASEGECFQNDFLLPAENNSHMGEGCVTTTWLQFNQALYNLTGEAKYMDEIEKSIFNHLLAAENPETGCVSYYTALQGEKHYRCTIFGHCCLASVPRGIAAIPELVYTKNIDNGLNINIYTAGNFSGKFITEAGKAENIEFAINSNFPEEGKATIILNPSVKSKFQIRLRVPAWSKNFTATINGKNYNCKTREYLTINQDWDKKSEIQVSFDLNQQILDGGNSYPDYEAIKISPQILAFDLALNPDIKEVDKITMGAPKLIRLSRSLLPDGWIGSQLFLTKAFYKGKPIDLKLVPFADAGQTGGEVRVWIKRDK